MRWACTKLGASTSKTTALAPGSSPCSLWQAALPWLASLHTPSFATTSPRLILTVELAMLKENRIISNPVSRLTSRRFSGLMSSRRKHLKLITSVGPQEDRSLGGIFFTYQGKINGKHANLRNESRCVQRVGDFPQR